MGTYGFVRIAMPMLPDTWRRYAPVILAVGLVSVLYGALVALAQENFKRMIAYTSVNHMGYIILAVGAAGLLAGGDLQARQLAVTGAVTQMVSHGLITGALFLLAGVLYDRGHTYQMGEYGGLAGPAPLFGGLTAVAAFASLGLPGFSGFIAEFQIFTGSIAATTASAVALLGILVTAGLFLRALQRVFLGQPRGVVALATIGDVSGAELASIAPLLLLALLIGVFPRFLLDLIEPASRAVVELVTR
jgi:NADH-quinone oxidoreductase subunit M